MRTVPVAGGSSTACTSAATICASVTRPVRRAGSMKGSVLLLQGTEDPVVPPAQAESLRRALVATGTHCDLRLFDGEGHGFRRAETLTACLEAELAFYLEELSL